MKMYLGMSDKSAKSAVAAKCKFSINSVFSFIDVSSNQRFLFVIMQ